MLESIDTKSFDGDETLVKRGGVGLSLDSEPWDNIGGDDSFSSFFSSSINLLKSVLAPEVLLDFRGVLEPNDLLLTPKIFFVPDGLDSSILLILVDGLFVVSALVFRSEPKLIFPISPNILPLAILGSSFGSFVVSALVFRSKPEPIFPISPNILPLAMLGSSFGSFVVSALVFRSEPEPIFPISPNILPLAILGSSFFELDVVLVVEAVAIEEVATEDAPSLHFTANEVFSGKDLGNEDIVDDVADPIVFFRTKGVFDCGGLGVLLLLPPKFPCFIDFNRSAATRSFSFSASTSFRRFSSSASSSFLASSARLAYIFSDKSTISS